MHAKKVRLSHNLDICSQRVFCGWARLVGRGNVKDDVTMKEELTAMASILNGSPIIVRILHGKVDAAKVSAATSAVPITTNMCIEY